MGKKLLRILPKVATSTSLLGSFTCRKLTTWEEVLIAGLIAFSTCFGHHYAHHQDLKSIIQWLLPVVFGALVFKLWSGDAAASCKPDT